MVRLAQISQKIDAQVAKRAPGKLLAAGDACFFPVRRALAAEGAAAAIVVDERRLKQALFNLVNNSVKFTPEDGMITLSARRQDDSIVLGVADTGGGISQEDRPRVFERFERGTNLWARQSGAGLGLALVKSFIELHGGRIELESESGIGTRVVCYLPSRIADLPKQAVHDA